MKKFHSKNVTVVTHLRWVATLLFLNVILVECCYENISHSSFPWVRHYCNIFIDIINEAIANSIFSVYYPL